MTLFARITQKTNSLPYSPPEITRVALWAACLVGILASQSLAQGVVPGTGYAVRGGGDDFEDKSWGYTHNHPKSSWEQDENIRHPAGFASNRLWYESLKRGSPDVIRRVPAPDGSIPGSKWGLLLMSRNSGIPDRPSFESEQDDLIFKTSGQQNPAFPVSWYPSVVTRVYLPPVDQWDSRRGSIFGLRAEVVGSRPNPEKSTGLFSRGPAIETEESWPGIFIQHEPGQQSNSGVPAHFIIRGNESGDFRGPNLDQVGWWTLGISFTPDGRAHYYARPGVEDLEPGDHMASHYPYGFRCERMTTMFFDVFNLHDGRSWSTPIIIDDPQVYVAKGGPKQQPLRNVPPVASKHRGEPQATTTSPVPAARQVRQATPVRNTQPVRQRTTRATPKPTVKQAPPAKSTDEWKPRSTSKSP